MMGLRGGLLGCGMPCPQSLFIKNKEELDRCIKVASMSGNWTAYLSMCAYIWEAHALQKEMITGAEYSTGEVEDTQLGATRS